MATSHLLGEAMLHPGLILLLVTGGSLIVPALYNSLVSIRRLLFSRHCFRTALEKRITASRLDKMLTRKGIDLQYYLFSQHPSEIEKQIRNCKCCDSFDRCDGYLEKHKMDNNIDLPFCKNNNSISKIKHQQEKLYILRNMNL